MTLATPAQLRKQKGEDRLALLFPGLEPAAIDQKLTEVLASASQEVLGYLTNRYADRIPSLTPETCPAPLRDRVIVLAWWFLLRDGEDIQAEPAHRDYKDALTYLGILSNGGASLVFDEPTAADRTEPVILTDEPNTAVLDYFKGP